MYAQSDEVYPVEELPIPLAILLSDWPQIADVSTPPQSRAPFVEFRARDRLPGHAFVAYGEQITTVTGNVVMVNQAVFGFYPVSDASKLQVKLLSTNGQLGFKMADLRSTVSKAFFVDDKTFSAVKAVFQKCGLLPQISPGMK